MTDHDPVTPPTELVQEWVQLPLSVEEILLVAAQWGADQELEACCDFLYDHEECDRNFHKSLRNHRRPKPPSLKAQALEALDHILNNSSTDLGASTIRRALEALSDD